MKVLNVVHRKKNGGAEKQAALISNILSQKGVDNQWIETYNPSLSKLKALQERSLTLLRLIRKEKINTVIVWVPFCFPFIILARLLCWRVKFIYGFRGSYRIKGTLSILRIIQFFYFFAANAIISNVAKKQLYFPFHLIFGIKKIYYVRNIIPKPPKMNYSQQVNKKIYFAGRLVKEKGIHNILQVARTTTLNITISGRGAFQKEVEALANTHNHITYTGHVPSVIDTLLELNGFLILPSLQEEGIPNVVLEALSVGMPVILSDVKEHRYLFTDKILYYVKPDLTDLEQVLEKAFIHENKNRKQLITKRLEYIEQFRAAAVEDVDNFIKSNFAA